MAALPMAAEVISIQGGAGWWRHQETLRAWTLGLLTLVTESIQDSVVITLLRNGRK